MPYYQFPGNKTLGVAYYHLPGARRYLILSFNFMIRIKSQNLVSLFRHWRLYNIIGSGCHNVILLASTQGLLTLNLEMVYDTLISSVSPLRTSESHHQKGNVCPMLACAWNSLLQSSLVIRISVTHALPVIVFLTTKHRAGF